ncbi:MAG: 1-acyl-sn-glycerol-3-phosphate acyltransferase [Clostridia bacterium]|nr:1-acyl-sn-glycerol-3-phosphate acyltransferase [Clostridia bacterium]
MKKIVSFILLIIFYIPLIIIYPTIIVGRKNLRRKGRLILCCNHRSGADPVIMWSRIFRRRFKYMAKAEIFKNKFGGYIFSCIGAYPVNRGQTDLRAIKQTLGYLKQERAICIFPEGTRLHGDELAELKSGVIIFALKANAPLVPSVYKKKLRPFRFNKLTIGKEFNLADEIGYKSGEKITDEIIAKGIEVLAHKMNALKGEKSE